MKFFDIQKEDFKNYRHELILTICYTVALILVYVSWAYSKNTPVWACILIGLAFIIAGTVFFLVWLKCLKKKAVTKEEK